jgi:hypothetical protein
MKLVVKAGGVPPGSYVARFLGAEPRESQFGPGLLWQFEVASGQQAGAKATGMTGSEPTAQNKCGRFLAAITGKPLSVGESVDLTAFVGRPYLIVVEKNDKGSRVATVTAAPTA